MPWRCAALEDLDDDHASTAALTRARDAGRLVAMIIVGSIALGLLATEQLAGAVDVVGAGGLSEQAVMADAVEVLGQDVDEEAADELVGCEHHHVAIGPTPARTVQSSPPAPPLNRGPRVRTMEIWLRWSPLL